MAFQTRRLTRLAGIGIPLLLAVALLPGQVRSMDAAQAAAPSGGPDLFGAPPPSTGAAARQVGPATAGSSRLVSLHSDLIPARAAGQKIELNLFPGTSFVGTFDAVSHAKSYTAWSGHLNTALGTFSAVRAGSVYRIQVNSPQGNYVVSNAGGNGYWISRAPLKAISSSPTDVQAPQDDNVAAAERQAKGLTPRKLHDSGAILDVAFGYNDQLVAQAGSYDAILAYVGWIVSQTNSSLAASGDPQIQLRLVGLFHTKTNRSSNFERNLTWLEKPHDGHYDDLVRDRRRSHADIVHLLVPGTDPNWCGFGAEPVDPANASPSKGYSETLYYNCSTNYSPTHELGHNMGADHQKGYPQFASHGSKLPYAAGWYSIDNCWVTIMSYWTPIQAANPPCFNVPPRITFLPYYSTPAGVYNGLPIGVAGHADNARAIAKVEPQVARYALSQIYHGKIRIKGKLKVGHRLKAKPGHWAPRGHTHFSYQWTLDGVGIRGAHHKHLRLKGKYFGHGLAVIITGHAKTYTPVAAAVGTKHAIKRGRFHHKVRPGLQGRHQVGKKLHLQLHKSGWHPRFHSVRVTWYRGHHKIKGAHGKSYRLHKQDRGKTIHAKVHYRKVGYHSVVRTTPSVRIRGHH